MEAVFMGVAVSKVSGVRVRGTQMESCKPGSFHFEAEDTSVDGSAYVSWSDSHRRHRVLADEIAGITWSDE